MGNSKISISLKSALGRVKRTKIWGVGGVCNMHVGIFDFEHVEVSWGHLVHFFRNWAITQKPLIVDRNGRKFGSLSVLFEKRAHDYNSS